MTDNGDTRPDPPRMEEKTTEDSLVELRRALDQLGAALLRVGEDALEQGLRLADRWRNR